MGGLCACPLWGRAEVSFVYIALIHTVEFFCIAPTPDSPLPFLHWNTSSSLPVNLCFLPPTWAVAHRGMPSQRKMCLEWVRQTGPAHESVLPALTLIRKMGVCVCASIVLGTALYELWWTLPCNKFNLTAGTWCNATTTPVPLPHTSWTLHQGSLCNSLLFSPSLWHTGIVRWSVRGLEVKLLSFFFFSPVSVSASPPAA